MNRPDGGSTFDGTVTLSANTTSSEWTALEAGTLQFSDFSQLGGSHFEFNAGSGDSGTLRYTGGSTATSKTLWLDNAGITGTIDVSQAGTTFTWNPGAGNINQNLVKAGAGTLVFDASRITGGATVGVSAGKLVLTGSSGYTGATTVGSGRLAVNGTLGNTAVSVQSGGVLGGSGAIGGVVGVLAGGTLSPGNSIESLVSGTASFAAGSTFAYEVDSALLNSLGSAADLLVLNGDLNITSGALLAFNDITSGSVQPFVNGTTVFAMINYSGSWNGGVFTYGGTALTDGSRFMVGSQEWQIDYNYTYNTASPTTVRPVNFQGDYLPASGIQTFVAITAVPEPSAMMLAAAGALALGLAGKRRIHRGR